MTSCQEWTLHLLLCEFYDLFSSSNFKKILEIGNHVREWEWRERERELCDLLYRSRSYLFLVALPIESEPGPLTLVTRQFIFATPLLPPFSISATSATAGSPQELEERLLARCSAVRVQTINPLWPKWNQAQLRLKSHFIAISNCPPSLPLPLAETHVFLQHLRRRRQLMLASGGSRGRRQRRRRQTQSEPESKMLIKLIELSLSSEAAHTPTHTHNPLGQMEV